MVVKDIAVGVLPLLLEMTWLVAATATVVLMLLDIVPVATAVIGGGDDNS